MTATATWTLTLNPTDGVVIVKDVPAGICGPFTINADVRTQADAIAYAATFDLVPAADEWAGYVRTWSGLTLTLPLRKVAG